MSEGLEKLAELGWIRKQAFTWWDLDYSHDPREFLKFEEFEKRLEYLGNYPLVKESRYSRDLYVYTDNEVPITTLEIYVENQPVNLFITARPYTLKERGEHEISQEKLITLLKEKIQRNGFWRWGALTEGLKDMFLPHIRGFVKEKRGNRFLYYPVMPEIRIDCESYGEHEDRVDNMYYLVCKELERLGKEYLLFKEWYGHTCGENTLAQDKVNQARYELYSKRALLTKKRKGKKLCRDGDCLKSVEIKWDGLDWVVYDELHINGKDLVAYYPVRVQDMIETIPIAISTRTHPNGRAGHFVLGVFDSYQGEYTDLKGNRTSPRLSIFPFTNEEFAEEVAEQVSICLSSEFRSIILNRRKGCNYYSILSKPL